MPEKKYETPSLFLMEFTKELILNSYPEEIHIKIEEYPEFPQDLSQEKALIPSIKQEEKELPPAPIPKPEKETPWKTGEVVFTPHPKALIKPLTRPMSQTPQFQAPRMRRRVVVTTRPRSLPKHSQFFITPNPAQPPALARPQISRRQLIKPRAVQQVPPLEIEAPVTVSEEELAGEKMPAGFDLGKLNKLIRDPRVTELECSGPGKYILVRTMNKVTVTKNTLSQTEIQTIIEKFSQASKIPVIGGLFKAAVGNLIITAVISDIVGQRFIITKISPFTNYWKG